MTPEEKRRDKIIYQQTSAALIKRLNEIKQYSSVKALAHQARQTPTDYLWFLYLDIYEEVKNRVMGEETMRLKTDFMRSEFEWTHREELKQDRETEQRRQQTARLKNEWQRSKYLN
jgi:hypothetical protein